MTTELTNFLKSYQSTGQKDQNGVSVYTHTSMQKPGGGSFNIPLDKREELHRLIAQSVRARKPVYLTERSGPVKPITIDIDLKYPMDVTSRRHNTSHIKELLKLYSEAIITYVDINPDVTPIDAYVFQRAYPYPHNGNMKDGLHIMYPHIQITTDIQTVIREHVLKKLDLFISNPDLPSLPVKNAKEDIVDLAVIARNNWTMYGCQKPNIAPYLLSMVYRLDNTGDKMQFTEIEVPHNTEDELVEFITDLSQHNLREEYRYEIRSEMQEALTAANDAGVKRQRTAPNQRRAALGLKKQVQSYNTDDEERRFVEEAGKLVPLLALWRSDDTKHWLNVGLCLHNISPTLFGAWVDFSKRSEEYRDGDENRWHTFESCDTGLNIGSLHRWARLDNPEGYRVQISQFLHPLILNSASGASQDVAAVVYKMYRYQYVCLDAKGHRWAEFVNHTWKISEEGMSLKKKIGHEVLNEYLLLISDYNHRAVLYSDELKDQWLHKGRSLTEVTYKLRDISFKEKIMKECIIMFHDAGFEEEMDQNPYLVGMDNGIYDLANGLFRNGCPEDKISMTTHTDYPDFDQCDIDILNESSEIAHVQAIFEFMKQVFPIKAVRHYMYRYLASCLKGYNTDEKMHFWTGTGGNGKSKILDLFEMCFGDYCFKMPIELLTQKRKPAGGTTPELMLSKGRRFGSLQEPDQGAKLNTGLVKEYSGNDKLYIRGLFKEGAIMKPMFSMALLCNDKPKITSDDDGTWRRMVIIEFISKFIEGTPKGTYEFKRDTSLAHMFPEWAPWFFAILTLWFKVYKTEGLRPPAEVTGATQEYRKYSDCYTAFKDQYFKADTAGQVLITDAYSRFKDWYTAEFGEKPPNCRDFKSAMDRKLNQTYSGGAGSKKGWWGYTLQHPDADTMNEGAEDNIPMPPAVTLKQKAGSSVSSANVTPTSLPTNLLRGEGSLPTTPVASQPPTPSRIKLSITPIRKTPAATAVTAATAATSTPNTQTRLKIAARPNVLAM